MNDQLIPGRFRPYPRGAAVRLLVIEDEPRIAEILRNGLHRAGFATDVVRLCSDAREAFAVTAYDAGILDLGLPDGDGLNLLAHLRGSISVARAAGADALVRSLLREFVFDVAWVSPAFM